MSESGFLNRLSLGWSCLIITSIAVCTAPFFKEETDVIQCWLTWSIASGGLRPWAIYAANSVCNYPAFVPYLLCISQALINLLHADQTSALAILIIKLPNLIACLIGAWVCLIGVKPLAGRRAAVATALIYVLCLPLWFNAAIWGQWDALSSLAMIAALLAVANQKPVWAGAAIGWALSIKLHAIVILPAICIYMIRRWSFPGIAKSVVVAVFTLGFISLPYVIAGQGQAVLRSYTGAINYYPSLSEGAFNGWELVHFYNLAIRHQPIATAGFDGQHILGPITARQLGLIFFAIYTLWLCIGLARYSTRRNLIATAGMTAIAFFMLPTQVHQRYLVPAAAIFAIIAQAGYGKTYLMVMFSALINQWVVLLYEHQIYSNSVFDSDRGTFMQLYCILSVINLIGFAWVTWHHHRQCSTDEQLPGSLSKT